MSSNSSPPVTLFQNTAQKDFYEEKKQLTLVVSHFLLSCKNLTLEYDTFNSVSE